MKVREGEEEEGGRWEGEGRKERERERKRREGKRINILTEGGGEGGVHCLIE